MMIVVMRVSGIINLCTSPRSKEFLRDSRYKDYKFKNPHDIPIIGHKSVT